MSEGGAERSGQGGASQPRIGVIGLGEAGSTIAGGLKTNGALVSCAYDLGWDHREHGESIRARAENLGICLVSSLAEVARSSDLMLSCVTPSSAISVVEHISASLGHNHTFLDLNSVSPRKKETAASLIEEAGALMIDGAIMGSVRALGFKVPVLLSGPRSDEVARTLRSYAMNVEAIPGPLGMAAKIKILRSLFMKGLEALLVETVEAAKAYGAEETVMASICSTLDERPFWAVAKYLLESNSIHAARRAKELEDVLETLYDVNICSAMARASRQVMNRCARLTKNVEDEEPS